jgi:hypothetical protein
MRFFIGASTRSTVLRALFHVTGKAVAIATTTRYNTGSVPTGVRFRMDEGRFVEQ